MKVEIARIVLLVSAMLLGGCDNFVPSAESVVQNPSIQVVTDFASGDRLVCVGALVDGPCTPASAQALISGAANPDDVSAEWAGEGKVVVSVGSGSLEKSNGTAMNGKVNIEYQLGS